MVRLVGIRYRSAVFSACLFSVAGLIVPSQSEAEGKSSFSFEKNLEQASTPKDCTVRPGAQVEDCESDSKQDKMDLDRKGHKVKKSKSRGR